MNKDSLSLKREINKRIRRTLFSKKSASVIAFSLMLPSLSLAQATGAGVSAALTGVKDWIVAIANVLFVIVIVIGIIKTVAAFVQGSPNATRNLVLLIVAALVWFGFSLLVADFSSLGAIENI